jgi:hypothetical protein
VGVIQQQKIKQTARKHVDHDNIVLAAAWLLSRAYGYCVGRSIRRIITPHQYPHQKSADSTAENIAIEARTTVDDKLWMTNKRAKGCFASC